jgi:hypothetical protein
VRELDEVMEPTRVRRAAYWQEIEQIVLAIADAMALGISEHWPESFDDCEVG